MKKQRNEETKKQRNKETKKQRNKETKKQRNDEKKKQRNKETKKQRNDEKKKRRNDEKKKKKGTWIEIITLEKRDTSAFLSGTAITRMPAATAASTPLGASSNTNTRFGS